MTSAADKGMEDRIKAHITKLESFGTRYYSSEGNRGAQAYIESCLQDYGYSVERTLAEHEGASYASPWIVKAGRSEKFYLLAAHFDSISMDAEGKILEAAPGADDNASGVAVLLEAARALALLQPEHNIGFAFFNLEEINWGGSKAFAKEWREKGKRLDGVINIDGIGTWPLSLEQGAKVNYVVNDLSRPWMAQLEGALKLPLKLAETQWEDDHASFWAEGYPAIELTEEGCSPVMHSPQDTLDKVDLKSVTMVAEAVIKLLQKAF